MKSAFDAAHFIERLSVIPEEQWCTGVFYNKDTGQCCTFGHLGVREDTGWIGYSNEVDALHTLVVQYNEHTDKHFSISGINDNDFPEYSQPTPKQRVLAFLNDIKNSNV